ncbi:GH18521 [Drosophila grimshawi]|uniref:Metalloendopeptidase n=1 Tax=Drosophila grimshawi TaxID=7222 RepID=B4JIB9_DROGR|nr:GH18521 [Drosophila grimshawi]
MYSIIRIFILGGALIQAVPLTTHPELPEKDIEEPSVPNEDIIDLSFYGAALYGKPDRGLTAERVSNFSAETDNVNPEELGSYLEGDILIPQVTMRNGVANYSLRWPNGVIPYEIRGSFNAYELSSIREAMNDYHLFTCIRFVPHNNESDFVIISDDGSGCWSTVGRKGGQQIVNLQTPGCFRRPGTVIHELMHAVGFLHEQSRMERDDFVIIMPQNIRPRNLRNFRRVNKTAAFGVKYDFDSVMHYSSRAFSLNGEQTMVARVEENTVRMGQRFGFSDLDVEKINRMYNCSGYRVTTMGKNNLRIRDTVD